MAKPKLALIPAAQGDKFYSVLPSDGVGDFDFTRNSSATRIAPTGFIETSELFGSELVTNGDFATDSDWTKGTGWSIANGVATLDGTQTGSSGLGSTSISVVSGKIYKIVVNVLSKSSGFRLYDNYGVIAYGLSLGLNVFYITASSSSYQITPLGLSGSTGSIDNVSVKELIGKSRLNYDLLNGKVVNCPHYLLEPQSTNSVLYSQEVDNAWWLKSNCLITPNTSISPDGALNADKLTVASGANGVLYKIGVTAGSLSFFAKDNNLSDGKFSVSVDGVGIALWNKDGSLYSVTGGTATNGINYGNGWFRFSYNVTTGSIVNYGIQGNIGESIFVFGLQNESSFTYPTSYIPTNGTAITRAAETANGSGNAATFNSTEGVLMAEIAALANDGTNRFISLTNGVTDATNISLAFTTTTNQIRILVDISYVLQMSLTYTVNSVLDFNKIILKYKENDFALWVNGFEVATDPSGTVPTANYISDLSFQRISSLQFYGKTRELQYFDSALTDAQLETLTSWTSLQEMITSQLYTNY